MRTYWPRESEDPEFPTRKYFVGKTTISFLSTWDALWQIFDRRDSKELPLFAEINKPLVVKLELSRRNLWPFY